MKCPYYEQQTFIRFTDKVPKETVYSVCAGTLEKDRCACGGDRCKCDFYPTIREKAYKERLINDIKIAYENLGSLINELIEKEENKK